MAQMYQVLRAFPGPGGKRLEPGEHVDVTGWRNATHLIGQGRLIAVAAVPAQKEEARGKSSH